MKLFNNKLKPFLVDQSIIGEYMKQKYDIPMPVTAVKEPGEIQKLLTRMMYNVLNFLYNYFFIIAILFAIVFYLYRRYTWYQKLKKVKDDQKEKESNDMKNYFDNILSEDNKTNDLIKNIINPTNSTQSVLKKSDMSKPISNKMHKVNGNNNSYINHLKDSYEINSQNNIDNQIGTKIGVSSRNGFTKIQRPSDKLENTSHIRPDIQAKTVRFAADEFDSFGRNSINPKTGQILAFNETNSYSMY
jgi:hypothetical protein